MNRNFRTALIALLLIGSTACASAPTNLDLSLKRPSDLGSFVVELEPPASPPAINKIHSWQIKVTNPAGATVNGAHIAVDGGMPQHGHGLPTQPRVTRELQSGTYLLEGMKFSMTGWWEIHLKIDADGVSDTVTFNTVLGSSVAAH
jgi:YtkA-like